MSSSLGGSERIEAPEAPTSRFHETSSSKIREMTGNGRLGKTEGRDNVADAEFSIPQ